MTAEQEKPELVATLDGFGRGTVTLGGRDIGNHITGLTVNATSGHLTKAELKLGFIERIDLKAHDVRVPTEDEVILVEIGWATPEAWSKLQDEVRELRSKSAYQRADAASSAEYVDTVLDKVAEALGKYAPVEVKWSRVLEEVSELAARMEGLEK